VQTRRFVYTLPSDDVISVISIKTSSLGVLRVALNLIFGRLSAQFLIIMSSNETDSLGLLKPPQAYNYELLSSDVRTMNIAGVADNSHF